MATTHVKDLAKSWGIPLSRLNRDWIKAKAQTKEELGKEENDFTSRDWAYATGILKKMVGKKEERMNALSFMKTHKKAADFIEEVTSGEFNIPNTTLGDGTDKDNPDKEAFKTFNDDDLIGLHDVEPMKTNEAYRVVKNYGSDVLVEDTLGNIFLIPRAFVEERLPLNEPPDDYPNNSDDALYFPDPALTTYEVPEDEAPVSVRENIFGKPFNGNMFADVGFVTLNHKKPNPDGTYTNAEEKRKSQFVRDTQRAYVSSEPIEITEEDEIEGDNVDPRDELAHAAHGFDSEDEVTEDIPKSMDDDVDLDDLANDEEDGTDGEIDSMAIMGTDDYGPLPAVESFLREAENDADKAADEKKKEFDKAQAETEKEVEDKKKGAEKQQDELSKEREKDQAERDREQDDREKEAEKEREDAEKEQNKKESFTLRDIEKFLNE